jgi:hypothetical protein
MHRRTRCLKNWNIIENKQQGIVTGNIDDIKRYFWTKVQANATIDNKMVHPGNE